MRVSGLDLLAALCIPLLLIGCARGQAVPSTAATVSAAAEATGTDSAVAAAAATDAVCPRPTESGPAQLVTHMCDISDYRRTAVGHVFELTVVPPPVDWPDSMVAVARVHTRQRRMDLYMPVRPGLDAPGARWLRTPVP